MEYKVHVVYPDRSIVLPQEFGSAGAAAKSAGPLAKRLQGKAAVRVEPSLKGEKGEKDGKNNSIDR